MTQPPRHPLLVRSGRGSMPLRDVRSSSLAGVRSAAGADDHNHAKAALPPRPQAISGRTKPDPFVVPGRGAWPLGQHLEPRRTARSHPEPARLAREQEPAEGEGRTLVGKRPGLRRLNSILWLAAAVSCAGQSSNRVAWRVSRVCSPTLLHVTLPATEISRDLIRALEQARDLDALVQWCSTSSRSCA